jgi:hypothetical protein
VENMDRVCVAQGRASDGLFLTRSSGNLLTSQANSGSSRRIASIHQGLYGVASH